MANPQIPNPRDVARSAAALAAGSASLAASSVVTSAKMAATTQELMEEVVLTLRAARPLVKAISDAVDDGLLDDIRAILDTVSETQQDVRAAREAAERIVGLVDATLDGVGGAPGAKLVLRGLQILAGGAGVVAKPAVKPPPTTAPAKKSPTKKTPAKKS